MTAPAVVEHRYRPRGAAKRLLACRDPEVLLSGPAGTGKSRACLEKLHLMCLLNPGMRGLIVRKTQVSMTNTALVTFREHVAAESIAAGHVRWFGGSQQEAACYRYTNGSVINVGGMDKPTKIMSSEYDIVYVQEAIELTETDWEAITTRLRNGKVSFQQIIADTNPDTATHWLKKRCDKGVTRMIESRHEDNPVLVREDGTRTEVGEAYISKLDALTGVRRLRLKDGLWVAAEGQIYEDWTPAIHHVDRFDIPDDWTRWWSVDFGFTNPFVLQCWAEDHDGRLYLYREIYRTRRLVEDHAKDILHIVAPEGKWREPRPRAVICDHDAEDRATLERHLGLGTVAAKKTVSDGIQAVQARLRPAGDGKPRLFLLRDSLVERDSDLEAAAKPLSTVDEIPGYVWDVSEGKPPKETPVKENDHGVDALRYMVAERDLGGRPRVRFL
ncbi:phage terminase large subunit [Amycolatopsis thermoflava]|uniref:phage terminase large subunit n=1 Tax=Amycolatopsis thermoflava TaxID=84480 RepID=UPI00040DB553|nr:phage terminase large subunit [Amycolatopsis thermoflava]